MGVEPIEEIVKRFRMKDGCWRSKGFVADCINKTIAREVVEDLNKFIRKDLEKKDKHSFCRLVLAAFGKQFIDVQTDPNRPVPAEQAPQGPKYAYLDDDDSSTIEGMIRKNGNDLIGALGEKDHSVISRSECGKKADIAPSEMESVVSSAYSKMSDNTVRMNDLNLKNGAQPGFTK